MQIVLFVIIDEWRARRVDDGMIKFKFVISILENRFLKILWGILFQTTNALLIIQNAAAICMHAADTEYTVSMSTKLFY